MRRQSLLGKVRTLFGRVFCPRDPEHVSEPSKPTLGSPGTPSHRTAYSGARGPLRVLPRTAKETAIFEDQQKVREAKERGEWLPNGWEWVSAAHYRMPKDVVGARNPQDQTLVWVGFGKTIRIHGIGAPKVVIDMVWNRYTATSTSIPSEGTTDGD